MPTASTYLVMTSMHACMQLGEPCTHLAWLLAKARLYHSILQLPICSGHTCRNHLPLSASSCGVVSFKLCQEFLPLDHLGLQLFFHVIHFEIVHYSSSLLRSHSKNATHARNHLPLSASSCMEHPSGSSPF